MNQERNAIIDIEESKQAIIRRAVQMLSESIAASPFVGHQEEALNHVSEALRQARDWVYQPTLDKAVKAEVDREIARQYSLAARQCVAAYAEGRLSPIA